ncbi:hypothetical protein FBUS_08432 [Fasciolopsis buskii]|uniref:A-kinase anchor protein 7-like phosphoesterase domain-containing protein n=1 Tax=Fasciolopsis buskii TaxID=27845 RepID=A0A8E0S6X2_9TREM|nr:hypothetical protein FBUS_08432 [Fasciolopsis buski]
MLAPLVTHLNSALRSAGYRIPPSSRFNPHITLMKLNKKQYRRLKIDRSIVEKHSNVEFGSLLLRELHLCLMGASRDDQGFYRSYGSITLRPID